MNQAGYLYPAFVGRRAGSLGTPQLMGFLLHTARVHGHAAIAVKVRAGNQRAIAHILALHKMPEPQHQERGVIYVSVRTDAVEAASKVYTMLATARPTPAELAIELKLEAKRERAREKAERHELALRRIASGSCTNAAAIAARALGIAS